ncbi:MAG: hypothetical protein IJ736_09290 [Firmicutes bacterium]|nr:hypothetical protein [Bacillota bacterium]
MAVNSVGNTGSTVDYKKIGNQAASSAGKNEKVNESADSSAKGEKAVSSEDAVYEKSDGVTSAINSPFDKKKIDNFIKESEAKTTEAFQKMIESAVKGQVEKAFKAGDFTIDSEDLKGDLKDYFANMEVSDEERAEAQKLISDDGYYGIENTAQRLFDFAKDLSGGDDSKFQTLKDAVLKGFDNAAKLWGDDLPEISQKTYDSLMSKFDAWEQEIASKKGTAGSEVLSGTVN